MIKSVYLAAFVVAAMLFGQSAIAQFTTVLSGGSGGASVCGGYRGPGDIAGGAKIGYAIRAWTAQLCGNRFANITVSGVSADMLTSSTTGALVPQTINGSVCPNASTTLCVVTKWYDQTISNGCTGSCDAVKTSTEQLGVLTTTCPVPLTACIVFPTSTATFNQVAGNFTPGVNLTAIVFSNYTFGGSGDGTYVAGLGGSGGNAGIYHGSLANQTSYSCDGTNFIIGSATDGSWYSQGLLCGTSTSQLFLNGAGQGSSALTPNLTPGQVYIGGIFASGPVIYETEVGIWNSDISGQLVALNANQRNFYGFVAAGDTFWDSVAGSDANNCATPGTPCLTTTKMNALSYKGGHSINWKGGSNFTGCVVLSAGNVSGTSAVSPLVVQQYSTGAKPTITANCGTGGDANTNKSAAFIVDGINATVNGIAITDGGFSGASNVAYCIGAQNSTGAGVPTIIFENMDVSSCTGGTFYSGFSELNPTTLPNGICGEILFTLLNSTFHGATALAHDGGAGSGSACGGGPFGDYNMQATLQGILITNQGGNTVDNLSGEGMLLQGAGDGSVMQFTLAHDNGGNSKGCGSTVALWQDQTSNATFQFVEAYNHGNFTAPVANSCDQAGFDFDQNTRNGIIEYAYSHNNVGPGFLMFVAFGNNVFRYSISENDQWLTLHANGDDGGGVAAINGNGDFFGFYNLTMFLSGTQTIVFTDPPTCFSMGFGSSMTSNGIIENNICYNAAISDSGTDTVMLAGLNSNTQLNNLTMRNNDYWCVCSGSSLVFATNWMGSGTNYATLGAFQTATSLEANSINTNPSTGTWTAAGACTWTPSTQATWPPAGCPTSYSTVSGVVKGTGIAITSPGTRDYYANTVPRAGPLWNMGAYGGP